LSSGQKTFWLSFGPVFAIVLAIVLFVFQASIDFRDIPTKFIVLNTIFALLISTGISLFSIASAFGCRYLYVRHKKPIAKIAIWAIRQAADRYRSPVESLSIDEQTGDLVIRSKIGSREDVNLRDRFFAYNSANLGRLGIIEVVDIDPDSCLCMVFDRMESVEFWEDLEFRMKRDFQPPQGVLFSRQIDQTEIDLTEDTSLLGRLIRGYPRQSSEDS
jgi:hypothetical protein